MGWGIAIKNKNKAPRDNPFLKLPISRPELPEFDYLMDLYWGGPERRLTGITIRIIGVNAIALIILMVGILYLGQYQKSVIEARLQSFQTELELIGLGVIETMQETSENQFTVTPQTENIIKALSTITRQRIQFFDADGFLKADSKTLTGLDFDDYPDKSAHFSQYYSLQVLKNLASVILNFLPDRRSLPPYREINSYTADSYPDIQNTESDKISLSVWEGRNNTIYLTAATTLENVDGFYGTLLLTRVGQDIKNDINEVWLNVLKIFVLTLIFTILLSIYLSGYIARPLKKLAKAAEMVRKGQSSADDIPDMSYRHDEIGELSLVLKQMTAALHERMSMIEQFAADVSHEIKNPLTSLKSAVETAAIIKKDKDRKQLLNIIQHDVERLDRLITDISNASRLDAELAREEFYKLNLKNLLHKFLDSYANPLQRHAVSLGTSSDNEVWDKIIVTDKVTISLSCTKDEELFVWGVESRLGQCLNNILSNALSFSPDNGRITIQIIPLKRRVSIVIEDEGPGIPPSKLENIFERFYSERPQGEEYGRHSGLGLSICKHIIEAHGGRIFAENVRSPEGDVTGARFTMLLNKA